MTEQGYVPEKSKFIHDEKHDAIKIPPFPFVSLRPFTNHLHTLLLCYESFPYPSEEKKPGCIIFLLLHLRTLCSARNLDHKVGFIS